MKTMNKIRFFSILLCLCLLCTMLPVTKANAATSDSDIAISSAEDLLKMRDNPSGSYYLTNDITVSENMQVFNDLTYGEILCWMLCSRYCKIWNL